MRNCTVLANYISTCSTCRDKCDHICLSVSSSVPLLNVNFLYPANKQWLYVTVSRRLVVKVPPMAWGHSLWFVKQPFLHIVSDVFSPFPSIYSGTAIRTLPPRLLLVGVHSKEKSQHNISIKSLLFLLSNEMEWKVNTDIWLRKSVSKSANKIWNRISHQIHPRLSELLFTFIVNCLICIYVLCFIWYIHHLDLLYSVVLKLVSDQ